MNNKLAILIACHNRKYNTLKCLSSLVEFNYLVEIYLVDDNSSDGTFEAVNKQFPEVHLIRGGGNLFWSRGMSLAWEKAAVKDFEYYLWINDDVLLYPNCFDELFECLKICGENGIISGIVESEKSNKIIYGGYDKGKKILCPNGKMQPITYMNGNVVLIPKRVYMSLGNLDKIYHHDLGDLDYGLRAIKEGYTVYTTRVAVASGEENYGVRERLNDVSVKKRFIKLYSPLGSNPLINFYFRKKHFGFINAVLYFVYQHFLNLLPDVLVNSFSRNKTIKLQ